jgi:hypothetical protein
MKVASRNRNQRSRNSSRGRGRRAGNSPRISGIHNRRDKRFFCDDPGPALEQATEASAHPEQASAPTGDRPEWNEAIMLWLSWNSTYEKATAKMYKGASKEKLRAMLNEMEYLRKQAIERSQGLLGCSN